MTLHSAPAPRGRRRTAKTRPEEAPLDRDAAPDGERSRRKRASENVTDIKNAPDLVPETPEGRPNGAARTAEPGEGASTPVEAELADASKRKSSPAKPTGRGEDGAAAGKVTPITIPVLKTCPKLATKKPRERSIKVTF